MATLFVLVGAEGMADQLQGVDWAREATKDEHAAFCEGLKLLCKAQLGVTPQDYFTDNTGRPYWLVAVLDNAPAIARERAERFRRVVCLLP